MMMTRDMLMTGIVKECYPTVSLCWNLKQNQSMDSIFYKGYNFCNIYLLANKQLAIIYPLKSGSMNKCHFERIENKV